MLNSKSMIQIQWCSKKTPYEVKNDSCANKMSLGKNFHKIFISLVDKLNIIDFNIFSML